MAHASIVTTLPRDAAALAARYDLGAPLARYQAPWRWGELLGASVRTVVGLCCLLYLFGLPNFLDWFLFSLFIVGLTGTSLRVLFERLITRRYAALICTEGLLWIRSSKREVIRWTEVAEIIQKPAIEPGGFRSSLFPRDTRPGCTICRTDGSNLTCRLDRSQVRLLADAVGRATLPYLLPVARAVFQSGAPVTFGALRLDQHGIHHGSDLLPWSQYRSFLLTENMLSIWQPGGMPWLRIPLWRVSNLLVLTKLLDEMRSGLRIAP